MGTSSRDKQRSHVGFGSVYRKVGQKRGAAHQEIEAVLGGQTWMVKPDKKARDTKPCLWQQAGVVGFKSCHNFYDCVACKYDQGMLKQVEKGKQISWQNAMRHRPALDRVCRHSLTHRIARRACAYDYRCDKCDFDQYFEDVLTVKTESTPADLQQVRGFDVPMDRYFHNGHTWARIESGGCIRIGLDDFALKLLGEAQALDLPLMGQELDQGRAGWGLKRNGNTADVLSPVGGVIMEVNARVREQPETANREPYRDGWLFMVRAPNVKKSVKGLMADTSTLEWIDGEVNTLESMIEDVAGPLAADGGYLQPDIYGNLPDLGWNNLTKAFLKT
jgi:glycine cleavage system H lipoate-binding protein